MAEPIRTNLNAILAALIQQLVSWPAVPDVSDCYVVDNDAPELTQSKLIVMLRPRGETPVRNVQESGGRVDRRVRRKLGVLIYTQLDLDEVGRASSSLTDATFGHLVAEDDVVDALDTFQPVDLNGNALTYEPVAWLGVGEPRRNDGGWSRSVLEFDVPYLRNLDQSMQ